jgi:hypothetical protein
VVLTDSHGISRAPCYLGSSPRCVRHFSYGAGTLSGRPFKTVHLYRRITFATRQSDTESPTTPNTQRLPAITRARFSLFRFRSPLLTESLLFSLPVGTEMFHFPTFPLPALYIQAGVTRSHHCAWRGFPIRKSSDQNLLISSPRLIADCYVLLRLQMPRHPPFALKDLKSHEPIRRSSIDSNPPRRVSSSRCSRPLCSSQSTGGNPPPATTSAATRKGPEVPVTHQPACARSLRTQQRACPTPTTQNRSHHPKAAY